MPVRPAWGLGARSDANEVGLSAVPLMHGRTGVYLVAVPAAVAVTVGLSRGTKALADGDDDSASYYQVRPDPTRSLSYSLLL